MGNVLKTVAAGTDAAGVAGRRPLVAGDLRELPAGVHVASKPYRGVKYLRHCQAPEPEYRTIGGGKPPEYYRCLARVIIPKGARIVVPLKIEDRTDDKPAVGPSTDIRASELYVESITPYELPHMACASGVAPIFTMRYTAGEMHRESELNENIAKECRPGLHCYPDEDALPVEWRRIVPDETWASDY